MKRFLINLDSRRAGLAFVVFLTIGAACIVANVFLPVAPVATVVLYGLLLFYVGNKYMVVHGEMTKNSPYFLAFSLFLISLYTIFVRADLFDEKKLLPQIGAALLPTVIAVGIRQLLFAYDVAQREQDAFYRTLEQELRSSAAEFKMAQLRLVEVVKDFVETRATLFSQEEEASRKYLRSFAASAAVFEDIAGTYPAAINKAVQQLNSRLTRVATKLEQFAADAENIDSSRLPKLAEAFEALTAAIGLVSAKSTDTTAVLQEFGSKLAGVPGNIDSSMTSALRSLNSSNAEMMNEMKRLIAGFADDVSKSQATIHDSANFIKADLQAIDDIISEVVRVLEKRIATAAGLGN